MSLLRQFTANVVWVLIGNLNKTPLLTGTKPIICQALYPTTNAMSISSCTLPIAPLSPNMFLPHVASLAVIASPDATPRFQQPPPKANNTDVFDKILRVSWGKVFANTLMGKHCYITNNTFDLIYHSYY